MIIRSLAYLDSEYERSSVICKHSVKLESQIASLKRNTLYYLMLPSKLYSLLRHRKCVPLYKRPSFPFPVFQHFKFSYWFYVLYETYQWRNSKTNEQIGSNILIRCTQSVTTCRLLFLTLLCIATITVSVILQQFRRLASLIGYSCVKNYKQLPLFPRCGPFGLVSRDLVTKVTTIQVRLRVDQHKNLVIWMQQAWKLTCKVT